MVALLMAAVEEVVETVQVQVMVEVVGIVVVQAVKALMEVVVKVVVQAVVAAVLAVVVAAAEAAVAAFQRGFNVARRAEPIKKSLAKFFIPGIFEPPKVGGGKGDQMSWKTKAKCMTEKKKGEANMKEGKGMHLRQ